jgi:putative transposase
MKAAIEHLQTEYAFSERRACGLVEMAVTSYRYRTRRSDEELRTRLVGLAREKPRFGYRRLHVLLQRSGERLNHKRVHRVYREAGLCLRRKKRKHCVRSGHPLRACTAANQEWALDFVHDAVAAGNTEIRGQTGHSPILSKDGDGVGGIQCALSSSCFAWH